MAVTDRCGDLVLSWAGPKPCQTRDGHSWWVGPLFSFCLRAPCSSFPPVGGAGGCRGVRTPARPWPPVAVGLGSADAADTLAGLSPGCLWWAASSPWWGGGPHPMPRCSPPGRAERVAPGSPWCPWSAPGRLRCLKPSGGAVPFSQRTPPLGRRRWRRCPRWAGGRIGERRHTRSPRCGERAPCRPRPATAAVARRVRGTDLVGRV